MDADQKYLLQAAERQIAKENEKLLETRAARSKQPRFGQTNPDDFWASTYNWIIDQGLIEPPYVVDSRKRDSWLRDFWKKEPHLKGVINSACLIDSNRGFSMMGGRNQVKRYAAIAHGLENGKGWRFYHRKGGLSFRCADFGFASEIGRDGINGPLRTLWNLDPARCRLTANVNAPLRYYPKGGKAQDWRAGDFMRITSMPSDDEAMLDLGYCALSRAVEVAKTMIAVYQHDQEQLGARAPRGLLILKNISEGMWDSAMRAREGALDGYERQFYGGVAVLASAGFDDVDAKLIALSQLPKDFDRKIFTDLLMYAYALCFGYSPEEFWPVSSGSLGRDTESKVQHSMATSKGGMDYINEFQENFQKLLPETVKFTFDERDDDGELKAAEVKLAKINVVRAMYEAGLQVGMPMIELWQAQYLLAQEGLIPQEWTEQEEDITVDEDTPTGSSQTEQRLYKLINSEQVQRCIETRPNEPLILYRWDGRAGSERVIAQRARDVYKTITRGKARQHRVNRQTGQDVLFSEPGLTITEEDVDRAISDGAARIGNDWLEAISSPPMTQEEIDKNQVQ